MFIRRDAGPVFGYLTSPASEAEWRRSVLDSTLDEPGDLRMGSSGSSLIRFMGRDVDLRWRVVEFEPGARLCRQYESGVRGGRDRYVLQPFGIGATIVEVEVEVQVAGLMGLLTTSRRTSMQDELHADLQRLKDILESA